MNTPAACYPAPDPASRILDWAWSVVPFYRSLTPGRPLPIVSRAMYHADLARFQASPPPPDVETMTSSGSSGQPLTVTADRNAWHVVNHVFFCQIAQRADLPAESFRPGQISVLFVSNKPGRRSFVRPLPELRDSLYLRLQIGTNPAAEAAFIARSSTVILYGKPTYLLDLRRLLIDAGHPRSPLRPRLLLTSGEPLHADDRTRLRHYFDAPIVDALASTEGGLIAATEPDGPSYPVFPDNVRLEVLAPDGSVRPAGPGELLVTNLVNQATVFLRYRSGDHAVLETSPAGQSLSRLSGPEPEQIQIAGSVLPAELVSTTLGLLPGVGDFQLDTSPDRQPVLRWSADSGCPDRAAVSAALADAFAEMIPGVRPSIEQLSRITPPGGKKHRFVAGQRQFAARHREPDMTGSLA